MENTGKYISGIIFILLSIGIYFYGQSIITTPEICTSWTKYINPICWASGIVGFLLSTIFLIFAIYTALFGIFIFAADPEKTLWIAGLYIFLTLFVIDLFLPDPIPFVDEIFFFLVTSIFGIKSLSETKIIEKIGF